MAKPSTVVVLDVGKTLSKLSFWTCEGEFLERHERPNLGRVEAGVQYLDITGIGIWLMERLRARSSLSPAALVPVAHGAGVAMLVGNQLACSPLDYEQAPPADVLEAYRSERDAFALTGSPMLPQGLNLGAQLYWLERMHPAKMQRASLLPWAQYWSWFLTGSASSEVTSLGCHTDLWCPAQRRYSPLAQRRGWDRRFMPMVRADAVVGMLRPALAEAAHLDPSMRVLCGLHDSNAALMAARSFPELVGRDSTVLSTGTWFIAMRSPIRSSEEQVLELPKGRDCLLNVDLDGCAVPSARFMGGRELEALLGADAKILDHEAEQPAMLNAVARVLDREAWVLPTFKPGTGPYAAATGRWQNEPHDRLERCASAALYAAWMMDASLDLIGAREILLVEGRFARCETFVRALASLRQNTRVFTADLHDEVPLGALRLVHTRLKPASRLRGVQPLPLDLATERDRWRAAIDIDRWIAGVAP